MPIKIIVIGGSYAGVNAGKTLSKKFKDNDNVEITLLDKNPYHTLMTELHEVAGHRTEPESIKIDLFKIFAGRKANVVIDEIKDIDFQKQILKSDQNEYSYDYLIIAAGNEANFFATKGAAENAFTLWSYEDAILIRKHIEEMFLKASYEKDVNERKSLLTFAVCGGGFTGVEMAGELGEAKNHLADKYGVEKSEVTIYNIEALDRILNMLESDDQVKKVSEKYYKKLGIDLVKNSKIVEVKDNCIAMEGGEIINTYTLIWTAGIKNCKFSSSLDLDKDKFGRIKVNEYMQTNNYGNVYAAGDNAQYEDEDGRMPQIVEAAEQSAHTAALNIVADIEKTEKHTHKQNYHGFMVSVGSRKAVADTGFKTSGWFAMLIKHMVNFYYGIMVGGLRQFWSYIRHEFFHIKNKRSFVGGHFSKASPNFWLVPFRLWLGFMWLVEGIKKIDEGWLREAKMFASTAVNNIIQGAGSGADSTAGATQSAADVVTEAAADVVTEAAAEVVAATTGAADAVVETVSNLPGFAQWVVNHSPQGWGQPLVGDVPGFMQWIINKIVAPNAVPFQTMMVVTEIIIGLCLIVGLLTFLCSVISVVMTVGITLTGMSDATIIWYFFGGIALIAGAGSTFGLDYYVMPFLKRKWKRIGIVKKSYLYFD